MARTDTRKGDRLNVRVTPEQKQVLEAAARLRRQSLSTFVLEEAYQGAQQVLADDTGIVLNEAQWQAFCAALDRPPREVPRLRALLSDPSVLDG